ncbi:MAG: ketoacyl-ACP synthase III [Acidobacteriota bacterium]|nr:ketoacyl-ACP synthase III [Acidobacteriota bacterium]
MPRRLARFHVRGYGTAFPDKVLGNEDLARSLGIDPSTIESKTGIVERRVAGRNDTASSLGALAAMRALDSSGVSASEIDLVLLSTYTPDHLLCPTGPELAHRIGADRAGAFDLNAACSGGVTALLTGATMLGSGAFERILVVTSDLTTKYLAPDDPKTRLIFGDGASALLLDGGAQQGSAPWEILSAVVGADGSGADLFQFPSGGSASPTAANGQRASGPHAVRMNGRVIFRFGVEKGEAVIDELCEKADIARNDIAWVIPHQANLRIISALVERTGIEPERWVVNIQRYGNTASSSVPIALTELAASGRLSTGDIVVLVAFGAGLTWSGLALRAGDVPRPPGAV